MEGAAGTFMTEHGVSSASTRLPKFKTAPGVGRLSTVPLPATPAHSSSLEPSGVSPV